MDQNKENFRHMSSLPLENHAEATTTDERTPCTFSRCLAKLIRVVTVPPVMVAALIVLLSVLRPDIITSLSQSLFALLFLAIVPTMAYPLSVMIPSVRAKGRNGQRSLAIYLSVAGYLGGCIYGAAAAVGKELAMIFVTYLISVIVLLVLNKACHIKASGHACSLTGPIALMCYFLGAWWVAVGVLLYAVILWASVKMGRHTVKDFLWGSASCLSAWVLVLIVGIWL